jgi:predicted dehydrogenase
MGELLCAIEQNREPNHSAANNLHSLELCFAAVRSADTGQPVALGTVQTASH